MEGAYATLFMSRKSFYRYNPFTEHYDRVFPTRGSLLWVRWRHYAVGALIGFVAFVAVYVLVDFPRERLLRETNERLTGQIELLGRRADEATAVLEDIAQRDNNFYRVLMQADPMTTGARMAGLERQRYYESLDSMGDYDLVKNVTDRIDRLDLLLYNQIRSFDMLKTKMADMSQRISHVPAIQPISSKYLKTMASGYGRRRDPIYGTVKMHEGMDFSADIGTPVYATGDGTVQWADWRSGYGNLIEINHGYNYVTRYAHLNDIAVRNGQRVSRGDLIGHVGNTGKSTGPHLHYEVRLRGVPQNPVNYYFMDLTPEQYDRMISQAENAGHVMD